MMVMVHTPEVSIKLHNMARPCKFDRACTRDGCWFSHPNGRSFDERNPQDPTGEPLFLHSFEAAPKAIELLPGPKRSNSSEIDEVTRLVSSESSRMMDEVTRPCRRRLASRWARCLIQVEDLMNADVREEQASTWFPACASCTCCQGAPLANLAGIIARAVAVCLA